MAITGLAEYKSKLSNQRELISINIGSSTTVAGRVYDTWVRGLPAGVVPTTSVVPTNLTLGSLGQQNAGTGLQTSILGGRISALNPGNYIVADRLCHSGGLSGIVTGAQTTNLPTAALTRYTSGDGVMLGITLYGAVGSTATTITATYTNQAGTGSRVTPTVGFGGTGFREVDRLFLLPLQEGDTGVRSVESVTIAASTATAGNFGVTLFKPLYVLCNDESSGVISTGYITGKNAGGVPVIENDACVFVIAISQSTNAAGSGALILAEN